LATPWHTVTHPPAPAEQAHTRADRLTTYLEADPTNVSLMLDLAGELHAEGQLDLALRLAEHALAHAPDSSLAASMRVLCLLSLGRVPPARDAHRLFMATWTSQEAARRFLWVFQRAGQAAAYADDLDQLLRSASLDRVRRRLLVRALHGAGQPARALHHLQALMARTGPGDGADESLLALLLFDADELPQADAQTRRCMQQGLESLELHYVAASLCLLEGRLPQARHHLEQALALQPDEGRCLSLGGQLALAERQYPQAAQWLARAAQQMPAHVGSRHALGWCRLLMGDPPGAAAAFDEALALDPNFAESHGALAVLAAWQGRPQEAQRHLTRARRLDPACRAAVLAERLLAQPGGGADGPARPGLHDELVAVLQQLPATGGGTVLQFYRRLATQGAA
jgi:Tfp pilus assembly protein PilF